jgi:hypothetical protein
VTSGTIGAMSSLERLAGIALPAIRGIGSREIRAAALLGLAVTTWNYVCYVVPIMEISQSIPFVPGLVGSVISQQIRAFCLMVAIVVADRAVDEGARRRRTYALAAVFGCLIGFAASEPVWWAWRTYVLPDRWPKDWVWLHGTAALFYWPLFSLTQWLPIGAGVVFLYADRRAARRTAQLLRAAELDRIRRSKVALESRLQAMQARVEPQFLFNTLAQVERLFEEDPRLAARMLDDLIAYLRAAMPTMRDTSSTVGQEIALARAYLDIVRLRLGERLRVSIDVPAEARDARMPPMMLLPLIDHAVVRGLEPATAGGTIDIAARVGGGRLTLTIDDRGAGLVPETDGDGVATIRQRLDALYRGDARLDLRRAGPQATEAVLDLPVETGEPVGDRTLPASQ